MLPLFSSIIIDGGFTLSDELITSNEIHLQDVVCSIVEQNPLADDFVLYNIVAKMIDIPSLDATNKILSLIKLNKSAFNF